LSTIYDRSSGAKRAIAIPISTSERGVTETEAKKPSERTARDASRTAGGSRRARATKLSAVDVSVHFEGVRAVDGVDLELTRGEILGVIGPNGAGKTTLVNALSGFASCTTGSVWFDRVEITKWPPRRRARLGLTRTFQSVRLFRDLTVLENVQVGALATGIRGKQARALAWSLLDRFGLDDRANLMAGSLPHGEERRVGIIRALSSRPDFLLLDEPAAGLNEHESDELTKSLAGIRTDFECGLLVIEHDMRVVMQLCDRIQVLDEGRTICVGTPASVREDPAVLAAYLGTKRAARVAHS
jgi:branched-chain amino acid transport system ATP-binding protein